MSEKTCGTCQLAVEKYGDPTGTQLICRATVGHLRLAEDECDIYETDFETLCYKPKEGRMSELKPCPCCKGEAKLLTRLTAHAPRVYCTECRLNTGGCETEEEAVENWNRRANDSCEGCDSIGTEEWCGDCSRSKTDLYEPGGGERWASQGVNYCAAGR